jgi:homoserine dehydrogenase
MIPPATTPETTESLPVVEDVVSAFYLHMEVADRPGVLAQVAAVLAGQGVSIEAVRQSPKPDGIGAESATLVITTHVTTELALRVTAEALGSLDVVRRVVSVLRVEGA